MIACRQQIVKSNTFLVELMVCILLFGCILKITHYYSMDMEPAEKVKTYTL